MLYDLPCSSKLSSRPPQLPFTAPGMKAAFGRGDWRTEALKILSFQPRQTLLQPCGDQGGPWQPGPPLPRVCPGPRALCVFVKQSL